MGARSKARKRALDMLYIADVRQSPLDEVLREEADRAAAQPQRSSSWPYAEEIVRGVIENGPAIDRLIEEHAVGWTLARMPAVDRAILRVATWELVHNSEVPDAVAIAEVHGPHAALAIVDALALDDYYLFHAIRADLLRRLGRLTEATAAYDLALARTDNAAERAFLQRRRDEPIT